MILVDRALARHATEGEPDPGRHDRCRVHGGGNPAADQHGPPRRNAGRGGGEPHAGAGVEAYIAAGQEDAACCDDATALARAIEAGRAAVTTDPMLLATSPHVDVLLEVTGAVEEALPAVLAAIEHGKHVVHDERRARRHRRAAAQGARRRARASSHQRRRRPARRAREPLSLRQGHRRHGRCSCGNIKGLQDPYRTPTTQAGFAGRWGQKPSMVTASPTAPRSASSRRSWPTPRA